MPSWRRVAMSPTVWRRQISRHLSHPRTDGPSSRTMRCRSGSVLASSQAPAPARSMPVESAGSKPRDGSGDSQGDLRLDLVEYRGEQHLNAYLPDDDEYRAITHEAII